MLPRADRIRIWMKEGFIMKHKKLVAAITILSLTLSMGLNAFADGLDLSGVESAPKNTNNSVNSDDFKSGDAEKGIFDLGSTDVVTYSNGEYSIDTELLDMTVYPPFGWICLTQDLGQQLDLYTALFNDPSAVVQSLIQDGTHALLVDSTFNYTCELRLFEDNIGTLVGNSSDLSETDEAIILEYIKGNGFTDCTEAAADTFGNNRFYKFVFAEGTCVLYETYINSVCVDFYLYSNDGSVLGDDICTDVEYMLADFSAS